MFKLLIAEDEELERRVLQHTLKNSDLPLSVVGEADNGREAVRLAGELNPDIILMDIKMPGLSGLKAAELIKEKNPDTEIIILSAYGTFAYSQQAIKLKVTDYLLKPVRPEELLECLNKVTGQLKEKKKLTGPFFDITLLTGEQLIIQRAQEYILNNYQNEITLSQVAAHVHLSSSYFSRFFKRKTGSSFVEYLGKLRLKEACKLLVSSNRSIDEIALAVGFKNNSYFTSVFKKYEGITPSEYRIKATNS